MSRAIETTEPVRSTPVAFDVDVCVAGGGPSGICAAVASARNGASTLLIERYGFLGGMATAGLVNMFTDHHIDDKPIIGGIFTEWIDGMRRRGGYVDRTRKGRHIFEAEAARASALELCRNAGVKLLLHSVLDNVLMERSTITHAVAAGKTRLAVAARQFVDCTGDGDLAALAGARFDIGRKGDHAAQPMSLCFRMKGVDWSQLPNDEQSADDRQRTVARLQRLYDRARDEGAIDCPRENVLYFACVRDDEVQFNTTRVLGRNAVDPLELTAAELEARRQAEQFATWLRREVPGFEQAYLSATAPQIGVRESRHIRGTYLLTEDDVLQCRHFTDGIVRARYEIDIHSPSGGGTIFKSLPPGEWYEVPYRCLLPEGIDNLLLAGRCISADHIAHSSLRVMPIAAGIGQAAGTAAAMAAAHNAPPAELDPGQLIRTLKRQGQNLASSSSTIDRART
jgi:hypothetical protein